MKRKRHAPYLRLMPAACLSLILGLAWSSPAQAHTTGRAFAAFVNAPTLGAGPLYLADTGELSPAGGWQGAGFLGAQVPSVLSANVLNAATMGARDDMTGQENSSSSLADVVVLPGHAAQLTASFVRAQAGATDFGSEGSAEIHNLTFGGIPIAVTGLPNQQVEIPGLLGPIATLVINEQTATSDGTSQAITVNALHLILATGEEVILASARSFVKLPTGMILARAGSNHSCASNITQVTKANWLGGPTARPPIILVSMPPPSPPECFDFVTGGGFFFGSSDGDGRVNFGFNAGYKNQDKVPLMAHLNLIDHNTGRHVKVQSADSYGPGTFFGDPCKCRQFEGTATSDGATVTYIAEVCDFGEPGNAPKGEDKFRIVLSNGYTATSYQIAGGNIQLHKACPQEGCNANPAGASTRGKRQTR